MKSIYFSSVSSPPAAELPADVGRFLRNVSSAACCHSTIEGTLLSSLCAFLGVTGRLAEGESGLGALVARAYADIVISPSFILTGSAVPFCLSAEPKGGHYFLHVPRGADASTPVLLLLHGYGGNLLYFPWAIWKAVPEFILIAPSWQIDWSEGPFESRQSYVEAAMDDAASKIGLPLLKPWIIPLSQGGPLAFMLAAALPEKFSGLLGISTAAENLRGAKELRRGFPVRLLHGNNDMRISCGNACNTVLTIQQSGGDAKITVISADHFLVLSHRKKIKEFLRENIWNRQNLLHFSLRR